MNEQGQAILIVDDNPTNIQILNEILSSSYSIFFATTGQDALAIAAEENPDLILLDIMMPEMDGYEVCRRLKANPQSCETPVIFVTAMAEVEDETKGLELGAVDYITKPVSAPIVTARVKNHLSLVKKTKEVQKAYAELKTSQSRLLQQEKMASIGQLAAGVAHEINNPIGFVVSNLGSLQRYITHFKNFIDFQTQLIATSETDESAASEKEQRKKIKLNYLLDDSQELIEESLDGAERVRKIVQNLKGFSRVDQAEYSEVDIHDCLENTLCVVQNELKEKTTIQKDYGEIPTVPCYPREINLVFLNLLLNAGQAIDEQGTISIRTWEENRMACISIADTGHGILAENLPRLFEPFFTTRDVGKGTGLGLSTAYDIVKKHGGDLTVQSEPDKGATFTLQLPTVALGKEKSL